MRSLTPQPAYAQVEPLARRAASRYAQKAPAAGTGVPREAYEEFEEVAYYVAIRNR